MGWQIANFSEGDIFDVKNFIENQKLIKVASKILPSFLG
jgi:hypothetical protein